MCTRNTMGARQSQLIKDCQAFTIYLIPRLAKNSRRASPVNAEVRNEAYTYLGSAVFKHMIYSDLNLPFSKEGVIKINVECIEFVRGMTLIKVKGNIRVLKPTHLTKVYSVSAVKATLHARIPNASTEHKYPIRNYGLHLGSSGPTSSIRFYKMTTFMRLSA